MKYFAKISPLTKKISRIIKTTQETVDAWTFGDPDYLVETFKDGSQRLRFAEVGGTYDVDRDIFLPKKIYPSWVLNTETFIWEAPVAFPADGALPEGQKVADNKYVWNEENGSWDLMS
jgi:hypothetical protein